MFAPSSTVPPPALDRLPCVVLQLGAAGQLVGLFPERVMDLSIGGLFSSRLTPGSRTMWETVWWPVLLRKGALHEILLEIDHGDQGRSHLLGQWRREHGPAGVTYVGVLTAGTERQRLMGDLKSALHSLESMPGAVVQMVFGAEGLLLRYASSRLLDLIGVTASQAMVDPGRFLAALTPESAQGIIAAASHAQADGAEQWIAPLVPARASDRMLEISARRPAGQEIWHGLILDVTERERLTQELRLRASTDRLTRLKNRDAIVTWLQDLQARGRPFALIQLDCDRLRNINDSLGYDAGDELLRQLALRLTKVVQALPAMPGTTVATCETSRLQADEFALVLEGVTEPAQALGICDLLIASLAEPYHLRGMDLVTSVSVGLVLSGEGRMPEDLLRDAGAAMHSSKFQGRNQRTLFEPRMHGRALAALGLEADLRRALEQRQIRAAFQPIVDIATGRCVGVEALARWRHPERGEVSPAEFIPIAEESGLILHLGEAVLDHSCRSYAAWKLAGLPVPPRLSVNLSRAQLAQRDLESRVQDILARHGLPGGELQLEVTESMAMSDARFVDVLARLRLLGISLALDDFGTGHSSLASLQLLPVQQVKIDRSFVRDVVTSEYHRALIQASLQVARALKLDVVAEGIEHAKQASALAELGCRKGQGWLWSRALEADAFEAFLRRRNGAGTAEGAPAYDHLDEFYG